MAISSLGSVATPMDAQTLSLTQNVPVNPLNTIKKASPEKIDAVAKNFESQFVSQMLESMFSTLDLKDGLGGSDTEETFQSMMISEYGKVITRAGGLGVADQIKREMLKMQEVKQS